jgi:hypothetical protein
MDEVLANALSLADPESFLREGDHEFDDIHEEPTPPPPGAKPVELPASAGVN